MGERSSPSNVVSTSTVTPGGPTLTPDRTSLIFGTIASGARPTTTAQTIRLTQAGSGTVTWTAQSSAPGWLTVSPASGSGSGALTITVNQATAPTNTTQATITIFASGTSNVINPIPVTLNAMTASANKAPIGFVDTPADNTSGVTGALAITGWALDDVDVTAVKIYRDPVAGEPAALVYVGDATRVEDARPDVATAYATYPASYRAGWGSLVLTNMLPNRGNGLYRFWIYALDASGHQTLLGSKTVTCTNDAATQPFGTIDAPAPGETVSGYYVNAGWVLSRTNRADGLHGGVVIVYVDGVAVGNASGFSARPDIAALFPQTPTTYPGVQNAAAAFGLDTTLLANGVHSIAWVVQDDHGIAQGIGSRFFRVFNSGSALVAAPAVMAASHTVSLEDEVASAEADPTGVEGRRGFSLTTPFRHYAAGGGRVVFHGEELDRIELQTNGATAGYLWSGSSLRPLPIGSSLNGAATFVWQPGPGFVGAYDLSFVRHEGGRVMRQDVRIVLHPKASNRVGPQLVVDVAGPIVAGWAADLDSSVDTGIDTIHVWAYPVTANGHGDPVWVNVAAYGGRRPDVAGVYGDQFLYSGYGVQVNTLPPGTYDIALFPHSSVTHDFFPATVVRVVVR
jgi:hypothetical protein